MSEELRNTLHRLRKAVSYRAACLIEGNAEKIEFADRKMWEEHEKAGEILNTPIAARELDVEAIRYTCIGKGGSYELLGTAQGAGTSRGQETLAVYRDIATGALYYRTLDDFENRMEKV